MTGKELKEWRISQYLTQKELAEKLDCARETLNRIEKGQQNIGIKLSKKIYDLQQNC